MMEKLDHSKYDRLTVNEFAQQKKKPKQAQILSAIVYIEFEMPMESLVPFHMPQIKKFRLRVLMEPKKQGPHRKEVRER